MYFCPVLLFVFNIHTYQERGSCNTKHVSQCSTYTQYTNTRNHVVHMKEPIYKVIALYCFLWIWKMNNEIWYGANALKREEQQKTSGKTKSKQQNLHAKRQNCNRPHHRETWMFQLTEISKNSNIGNNLLWIDNNLRLAILFNWIVDCVPGNIHFMSTFISRVSLSLSRFLPLSLNRSLIHTARHRRIVGYSNSAYDHGTSKISHTTITK